MKQQLLVVILFVGSSLVRSIPITSSSDLLAGIMSSSGLPNNTLIPAEDLPASGRVDNCSNLALLNRANDSLALPALGKVDNCHGSWYCSLFDLKIAQSAIDGWESFVFYRPGTAMVASSAGIGRTTIFRCPDGYSGPGFIGRQIKRGLDEVLSTCRGSLCGRFVRNSYLYGGLYVMAKPECSLTFNDSPCSVTLNYCANCVPTNPAG